MKRFTLLLLLSLLLALSLAACGGTASEPAASEETAVEEPAAEEPAAEEPAADDMECTDPLGCVEVAPGDPISLASALVISGPNTELGLDSPVGCGNSPRLLWRCFGSIR